MYYIINKELKMKAKLVMTLAAATMILAGCNTDENEITDYWNGEIRLTSGVSVQTRANNTDVPDKQIAAGQTVYTWVDKAADNGATEYISAWTLTAQGDGTFTGSSQYYPTDGSNLDFYAMHGNFAFTEGSSTFPASAITHTVAADQSTNLGTAYLDSDLLYGLKKGVERSKSAVDLTFYHLLSKVEIALKQGAGKPALNGATVTIENTRLKAEFTPDKEADINNTDVSVAQAARAGLVTCPTGDNAPAPITIATEVTDDFSSATYAAAIIVPQTVAADTKFIKVALDGGTFYYKIPGGLTFQSGKKYQYNITVNQTGLTVNSKIEDWTPVSAIEGSAEME
ncbi:hypothetical protein HMPREF9446_03408 [Bacteroides fluxus YIT 12057]|uniref:Fimbrillin family protein n=2 Tax=Bacteroides fluxus TaxID=626930 RepID=F3PXB6_9BACE|nr:hypothetical protein HMPREF9446_03408 [Bacteroides fluxus YIT 12057]